MNTNNRPPQDPIEQWLLDKDLTRKDLQYAASILKRVEQDADLDEALGDYDQLRESLQICQIDDDVEEVKPSAGWAKFSQSLEAASRIQTPRFQYHKQPHVIAIARWASTMAAAVVMLMIGWWGAQWTSDTNLPIPRHTDSAYQLASNLLLPSNVQEQARAFHQVSEVFDRKTSWVAFSNGQSMMGLGEGLPLTMDQPVLLRLTVTHIDQIVSQTDLAIIPGQQAELTLPLDNARFLHYRLKLTRSLQPDLVLVATLLEDGELPQPITTVSTSLQLIDGQVQGAGQLVTNSGEYQIALGFRQVKPNERL